MLSPSAAQRPWPTCIGPTGFAETNSTCTRLPPPRSLRPKSSPCSRASRSTRCSAVARQPDVDEAGTGDLDGLDVGARRRCAPRRSRRPARGFMPACLAQRNATVVAQSPWPASRGRSTPGSGASASGSSPAAMAAARASVTSWEIASLTGTRAFRKRLGVWAERIPQGCCTRKPGADEGIHSLSPPRI